MTDSTTLPTMIGPYRNRIIGLRVMPVGDLLDNPRNWRKHPPAQAQGLDAVMRRIGVIDVVRFDEPTNHLWDGHLRKKLFSADAATPVIVLVTDLTEEEESFALATFDTLTGMARADTDMLLALLRQVQNAPVVDGTETDHPTSKPVELFAIPISQHTRAGEVCYEPFSGSGSQHVAGEQLGRLVVGLELQPEFCAVILERLAGMGLQPALVEGA